MSEEYRDGDLEKFFGCDPNFSGGLSTADHVARVRGEMTGAERAVIEAVKEWWEAEAATLLFIAEAREGGRGLTLKEAEEYYAFKDKEQATLAALRASADELLKG